MTGAERNRHVRHRRDRVTLRRRGEDVGGDVRAELGYARGRLVGEVGPAALGRDDRVEARGLARPRRAVDVVVGVRRREARQTRLEQRVDVHVVQRVHLVHVLVVLDMYCWSAG